MFDYTYGHSVALILLSFVILAALVPSAGRRAVHVVPVLESATAHAD
jgi:hypothetical protein